MGHLKSTLVQLLFSTVHFVLRWRLFQSKFLWQLIYVLKGTTHETNHAFDQLEPRDERLDDLAYLNRTTELNVERTQANILEESPALAQLVEQGDLLCVGGIYNVASGAIKWLE